MDELAMEISGVAQVDRFDLLGLFVELVQLPLGDSGIEPWHAGTCGSRGSLRNDDFQALKQPPSAAVRTAVCQPENAQGENPIDGGLRLVRIDGDHAPCRCSSRQHAACVGGAK